MQNNLNWIGIELCLDKRLDMHQNLIDSMEDKGIYLRSEDESNFLYLQNQSNYFILEDEFIAQSTNMNRIFNKLAEKNYQNQLEIFNINDYKFVDVKSKADDIDLYHEVLSKNIIIGLNSMPNISINVLHEVLRDRKSILIIDVLILFSLANKVKYEAEELKLEFFGEDSYELEINILKTKPLNLWILYDWIFNTREYEASHLLKIDIVRKIILYRKSLEDVEGILRDSITSYNRVISQKSDSYFEQLNKLKDDFIIISKNAQSSLRALNITFLAWLGTFSMELFKIVMEYPGDNLWTYLLFSKDDKIAFLMMISIFILISIGLAHSIEVKHLQNEFLYIKEMYDEMLFESNFNKMEEILKINTSSQKNQKRCLLILIIIMIIRMKICIC